MKFKGEISEEEIIKKAFIKSEYGYWEAHWNRCDKRNPPEEFLEDALGDYDKVIQVEALYEGPRFYAFRVWDLVAQGGKVHIFKTKEEAEAALKSLEEK